MIIDATPDDHLDRNIRILGELAELGMELARALLAQAERRPSNVVAVPRSIGNAFGPRIRPDDDIPAAWCRIADAVRHTIALQAKLERDRDSRTAASRGAAASAARRLIEQAREPGTDTAAMSKRIAQERRRRLH